MATKTNAVRLVQQAKINCREEFYDFDPNDLNGMHVAEAIGFPPEQVYKTLVAKGSRTGINVFCVPVCAELDLKKAAKSVGEKSVAMIPVKDINSITGYIRGGCTAIGMKKQYVTRIAEQARKLQTIIVSGGRIGSQIELVPEDLCKATKGEFADITIKCAKI